METDLKTTRPNALGGSGLFSNPWPDQYNRHHGVGHADTHHVLFERHAKTENEYR